MEETICVFAVILLTQLVTVSDIDVVHAKGSGQIEKKMCENSHWKGGGSDPFHTLFFSIPSE